MKIKDGPKLARSLTPSEVDGGLAQLKLMTDKSHFPGAISLLKRLSFCFSHLDSILGLEILTNPLIIDADLPYIPTRYQILSSLWLFVSRKLRVVRDRQWKNEGEDIRQYVLKRELEYITSNASMRASQISHNNMHNRLFKMKSFNIATIIGFSASAFAECSRQGSYRVTFFGYPDNGPPVGASTSINCGGRNYVAGGTGTFDDPISMFPSPWDFSFWHSSAMACASGIFSDCEIAYLPYLEKYIRCKFCVARYTTQPEKYLRYKMRMTVKNAKATMTTTGSSISTFGLDPRLSMADKNRKTAREAWHQVLTTTLSLFEAQIATMLWIRPRFTTRFVIHEQVVNDMCWYCWEGTSNSCRTNHVYPNTKGHTYCDSYVNYRLQR